MINQRPPQWKTGILLTYYRDLWENARPRHKIEYVMWFKKPAYHILWVILTGNKIWFSHIYSSVISSTKFAAEMPATVPPYIPKSPSHTFWNVSFHFDFFGIFLLLLPLKFFFITHYLVKIWWKFHLCKMIHIKQDWFARVLCCLSKFKELTSHALIGAYSDHMKILQLLLNY